MNNAELFKKIFGEYATEIWSKPENEFLKWLNESNTQNTLQHVKSVGCVGDTIYRQAAIDEIDEWIKAFRENGHKESAADACLIQNGIIQLPSAQPEQRWIPCSERLPQPNEEAADGFIKAYLVQDGRWMDVARWNGDCWIAWGYGTALTNVIAWMPLPEPYAERRTDE